MESSTQQNMAFRVSVKLNPAIHGDAIAALREVSKADLSEVVALFLQYGAMAHQRISAWQPVFDAGVPERAPGESKTKTASKTTSTLPGPGVNPLWAKLKNIGQRSMALCRTPSSK